MEESHASRYTEPPPSEQLPATPPATIALSGDEKISKLLALSVAARRQDRLRGDPRMLKGHPLQLQALQIMRNAAYQGGLERVNGDTNSNSVDHQVYDHLYNHFFDGSHAQFLERLGKVSQAIWHLVYTPDFEFSPNENRFLRVHQTRLVNMGDKLFRNTFKSLATNEPDGAKAQAEVIRTIDPQVSSLYLDEHYLLRRLWEVQGLIEDHGERERLKETETFIHWQLDLGKQLGHIAISSV